jgi:hypothetical protein
MTVVVFQVAELAYSHPNVFRCCRRINIDPAFFPRSAVRDVFAEIALFFARLDFKPCVITEEEELVLGFPIEEDSSPELVNLPDFRFTGIYEKWF